MSTRILSAGGYRFIPAVSQYSGGVAAEAGFRIERARFSRVVPLREGFELIEKHLGALGRPTSAFCACELRSPAPFTEQGFRDFNAIYTGTLERWGLMDGETNPVARSNVCPELDPPAEPGFYAFSYTVADPEAAPSFVVAGSAEAPEGKGDYRDNAIARGDISPAGIRTKAKWVLGEMERRMQALGFDWSSVTATQVYTVHDPHPFIGEELVGRGAMRAGLTWHFVRPPILELEYEMDCRGVPVERVLQV
ncbi:MAG: hypothetical protein M9951_07195 [Burkholderiaceae bacterium]|jgi:hypothetical protein|nr:hypothetical protein [Burkholderiaceae bacterium]